MAGIVPVVDITAPDAPGRLDDACSTVGFLSVIGHGVPGSVIDDMRAATAELFALPLDEKLTLKSPRPEVNRGYTAKGTEGLAYSLGVEGAPPDLFEAFNVAPEPDRTNIWPRRPASFRPALDAYIDEVRALAHRLTGLFATALGLDPAFFADKTDHSTDTLRVLNYERGPGEPAAVGGQQRMGAHTDYGIVTILYADPVPGLQIIGPDGGWHDVIPDEGAFLVNLGDLLAQWTNDRWRSTLHRVVPPAGSTPGPARRRSAAFFHDGNADARVECLPSCHGPDNPPRYPPVIAGEHLMAKLLGPRTLTASAARSTAGDRPVS